MYEVEITYLDRNKEEKTEHYGTCLAKNSTHAIQRAIVHCLNDYNTNGDLIEKEIIKVEIIGM